MQEPLNYQLPKGVVITAALARDAVKATWNMVEQVLSASERGEAAEELNLFFAREQCAANEQEADGE